MGESACLRRSLSHPSSAFLHPPEGDPIRCLTESVSFGRFVSESLAWERWSAFSHNRYLEEVQQISKAGSVAEKKAFFEAHYKRRAAMKDADKLEQANVNAGSDPEPGSSEVNPMFPNAVRSVSLDIDQNDHVHLEEQMQVDNAEAGSDPEPGTSSRTCRVSLASLQSMKTVNVMVPDADIGNSAVEPSVNLEDQVQVGHAESSKMDKVATPKERTAHEGASKKKNVTLHASKRLMNPSRIPSSHRDLKLPRASVKQETFSSTKAGDPSGGSTSACFISKQNSGSKALHMSISFSSCPGQKIRISPRNSTVNKSVFGRNITSRILKTVTEDCSRSSIGNGSKPKLPTVSSPFRFRSEERAMKRREARKLEERCSAREAETIHQEGKQQCKITKTQQSTNSGSSLEGEAPHHESKPRTRTTTRMSAVTPQPPKSGRKPPSSESAHERTLDSAALPKRKLMSPSFTSSPQRKRGHENAPPNIQR